MTDWLETWDEQQAHYLQHRDEAYDVVSSLVGDGRRVLDLAGGTGALARRIGGEVTVLDNDPVLLHLAAESGLATVVGDLSRPGWRPAGRFDTVVVSAALHYFPASRLTAIYAEIHDVLAPGGLFVNVDHVTAPPPASLAPWRDWWRAAEADPTLGPLAARRAQGPPSADHYPAADWHLHTLTSCGFAEAEVAWQSGPTAALVAKAT